jgi:hypothetical protein
LTLPASVCRNAELLSFPRHGLRTSAEPLGKLKIEHRPHCRKLGSRSTAILPPMVEHLGVDGGPRLRPGKRPILRNARQGWGTA